MILKPFNRFTADARRCVEDAVEEARMLGHDSIGDEDLLLGVLREGGVAARALDSLGVTAEAVRDESEGLLSDALASVGISFEGIRAQAGDTFEMRDFSDRRLPFGPRAKKALEQTLREAVRLRDNKLSPEHILLGILRIEDGTAVRILVSLGASPERVEDRLNSLLENGR